MQCLKIGRPLSKLKYFNLSDSELVPRGKDEKVPLKELKERKKYKFS